MLICQTCQREVKRTIKGQCDACYRFEREKGRKRLPSEKVRVLTVGGSTGRCKRCKLKPAKAHGLCASCVTYYQVRKKDRPLRMISRSEYCKNCGVPRASLKFVRDRCPSCYRYWLKYRGADRPSYLWERKAPLGWCDCGHKATHANVPLRWMTVDKEAIRTEYYNLCDDCYALENEPITTKGEATWIR